MDIEKYLDDLRERQDKIRPEGTPSDVVYPIGEITLPEHIEHWAKLYPDRPAIIFEGLEVTYVELNDLSKRLAGWLEAVNVRRGDRVGVYLPNCPQFIVAMLAVLRIGAIHVPINPMFQATELSYELNDSGAEVVITTGTLLQTLEAVRENTAVREVLVTTTNEASVPSLAGASTTQTTASGSITAWAEATSAAPSQTLTTDLEAIAALNYTGGTTGLPKGCEHTQRHMLYTAATSAGATRRTADDGYVALCYVPIFWIAGEDLGILNPLVLGGTSVLMSRWDPALVLEAVDRYSVSVMVGTVENYLELLDQPDFDTYDLSSLVDPMAVSFVQKLTPEVRHRWAAAAGPASMLREGAYGMTETHTFDSTPYGLGTDDRDLLSEPVFCGVPVPGTDIAVVSFETGEPVPLGEAGEIVVRSPAVMTGYWQKPEETAKQLRDGWLHTGDNGRLDEDGCLHYLGRDKDMIKVKGMSVFPAEVEMILTQHPDVQIATVVPAEHVTKGQLPVAFVSIAVDSNAKPSTLHAWATENMATYKVPVIEIVSDFPMTATGKIRKVDLVARAQELVDADPQTMRPTT